MCGSDESSTLDESKTEKQREELSSTMNDIRDIFRRQGLVRARHGRVLGGVLAGLGRRIGLDPWPTRLLFVLLLLVLPGCPVLLYPILWILMPREIEGQAPYTPTTSAPAV